MDDMAEMAALRRSRKYQSHQDTYGDRTAAKQQRENEEQRLRAKLKVDKEKREASSAQRKAEIEKATAEMMGSLPTAFGSKEGTKDEKDLHRKRQRDDSGGLDSASSEAAVKAGMDNIKKYKLPVSCEIVLCHGTRSVAAMGLDPKGGRLLTGGYDYAVKFWDFAGMTSSLQSFREIEPEEGHMVRQLRYNKGGRFLCISGYRCASVFTRDGIRETKYNRGDMYIHDLQHTVGHVAALTDGHWHPKDDTEFITASEDGTMRIWDVKTERRSKECIKLKPRQGGRRTPVTSCCFSPDGSRIVGAGKDGSLQLWERKNGRTGNRPKKKIYDAHAPATDTSCVMFASDNRSVVSRGGDGTMKLWDARKFKKPVKVWENLLNNYPTADVAFSPKGDLIVAGTSNDEKETGKGELVFFNRKTLQEVQRIRICQSSVIRVVWNARLNQIFCGCQDGAVRALYDPEFSKNGALLCVRKKQRKKDPMDFMQFHDIRNPHALPLFAQTNNPRQIRKKKRADPIASKKPLEPIKGEGVGGRIGNHNLTTHLMQCIGKSTIRNEDPREALLAYDDKAKADPMFYGNAYKYTQPKQIFADEDEDEDEESEAIKKAKKQIASAPLGADPASYRKEWK